MSSTKVKLAVLEPDDELPCSRRQILETKDVTPNGLHTRMLRVWYIDNE